MIFLIHLWSSARMIWHYRHEPENLRKIADVYWGMLLVLAALTFIGLAAYSGIKFYEVFDENDEAPLLSSGGGGIMLNRADLQSTLEVFDTRKSQYEYFKKNLPAISDPSR